MSADCPDEDNSWMTNCSALLLIHLKQTLLVCFGSLSYVRKVSDTQTAAFQMRSCDAILWCDSRAYLICLSPGENPRLCKWQSRPPTPPTHTNTITHLLPSFKVGVIQWVATLSPHINPPIKAKDFELGFVSPKQFISELYCSVFVCLGPLKPFDIFLNSSTMVSRQ